ncbi:MAG: LysM peptidoglycan-binding domain-containing protein, partial [Proteobacteria bacterium]|nr:LysM peptidoglycan-binding domain-containing protein [Pseudomonadota bacterium]
MSLSKISLNPSLRLTAATLALTLAGCGGNPPAYDAGAYSPAPPAASSGPSPEPARTKQSAPRPYEPVLEKIDAPVPLADNAPDRYVVQVGDTLWDIAATFLRDPWFWPEIWYVNPQVENPHLIYPGDVLGLVYIDGRPRITNVRASTYRLSPQARITPLAESVTSIAYDDVRAFLSSGVILEKDQADTLPYLLGTRGDHLIASAGNEIYVRGIASDAPGTRYSVVHVGD